MKKTFLKIAAISIISVSGVATFNIIQPTTYAQSKKTFSKNVQVKWTNSSNTIRRWKHCYFKTNKEN